MMAAHGNATTVHQLTILRFHARKAVRSAAVWKTAPLQLIARAVPTNRFPTNPRLMVLVIKVRVRTANAAHG